MTEAVHVNIIGGSEMTRDLFCNVMAEAGFDVSVDAPASADTDVAVLIAEDVEPQRMLNESSQRRSVVVADIDPENEDVADLVLNGADAVISLQATAQELAEVVRTVASGGAVIAPRPARRLTELARANRIAESQERTPLTNRELDILNCIGHGQSVKETAETLGISAKTVENLQSRLFRKLDVRNRAQAFAQAHALGLLPNNGNQ